MHPSGHLARAGERTSVIDLVRPTADGTSHTAWATAIAKRIARWRGFRAGSEQEAEIVSHAVLTLVRKLEQFAPRPQYAPTETADGHFRGWIHMSLRAECLRECKRERACGTFHTPPAEIAVHVEGLPSRRTDAGTEEVEIADHREPSPDFDGAVKGFQRRKRRWDTETGEEVAVAPLPKLSYPADERPALSGELVGALLEVDSLARAGEAEGGGL